ncbi:MAG TPA: hypothetical protein DDW52_17190 [Planctomycetaceae bacterium]|nr:hypothetical protein [Planctomycetaceae bacterium]
MRRSLIALWTLLIAAVVGLCVLAQLWITQRSENAAQRRQVFLVPELEAQNTKIGELLDGYAEQLSAAYTDVDLSQLSDCLRLSKSPIVDSLVVMRPDGQLHYPVRFSDADPARNSMLSEALQLVEEHSAKMRPGPQLRSRQALASRQADAQRDEINQRSQIAYSNFSLQSSNKSAPAIQASANSMDKIDAPQDAVVGDTGLTIPGTVVTTESDRSESGGRVDAKRLPAEWITWYHGRGMILGFFWMQESGYCSMAIVPRARWTADIVGILPDSASAPTDGNAPPSLDASWKRLIDIEGQVIYQWTSLPPDSWNTADLTIPDAELPVANPLEGWRLRVYASSELRQRLDGDSIVLPIWLAVGGMSLALMATGLFITLNLSRQMRLATQRVSFVNQVSHELKTPLTNILMYAELLQESLSNQDPRQGEPTDQYDDIRKRDLKKVAIIENESRRLSRLISGVLHFARSQKEAEALHLSTGIVDDTVDEVVRAFRPRLEAAGFDIQLDLSAREPCRFDHDAVEQILVNLVSNVEKYASEGKVLLIVTHQTANEVTLRVIDQGPGIRGRLATRIFDPFYRGDDRLHRPAGTGIGLTITRQLAQRHGGDCRLEETQRGASFLVSLAIQPARDESQVSDESAVGDKTTVGGENKVGEES